MLTWEIEYPKDDQFSSAGVAIEFTASILDMMIVMTFCLTLPSFISRVSVDLLFGTLFCINFWRTTIYVSMFSNYLFVAPCSCPTMQNITKKNCIVFFINIQRMLANSKGRYIKRFVIRHSPEVKIYNVPIES